MYKQKKISLEFLALKLGFFCFVLFFLPQCHFYLLCNNGSSFSITLVVREQCQERKMNSLIEGFLSVQLG